MTPETGESISTITGSHDGSGAGDHDVPYVFGRRPRAVAPYPFSMRQYARLLLLRSRLRCERLDHSGGLRTQALRYRPRIDEALGNAGSPHPLPVPGRPACDETLLGRLAVRFAPELDFYIVRVEPIDRGRPHNNRLSHLRSHDAREAVLKVYYRDDRHRLDREYSALHFLNNRGMIEVPLALLRDDDFGYVVSSFEDGTCRSGSELTSNQVKAIAAFAAALHHIHPGTPVDSCQGLASECAVGYVSAFRELAGLSYEAIVRSRLVAALMEIDWSVVHLSLVVPNRFAVEQFADSACDLDAHVAYQLACFRRRLARADHVVSEILDR